MPVNHAVRGTQPEEREEVWEGQVGERGQRKRYRKRRNLYKPLSADKITTVTITENV